MNYFWSHRGKCVFSLARFMRLDDASLEKRKFPLWKRADFIGE
jgi:hypothetical protein